MFQIRIIIKNIILNDNLSEHNLKIKTKMGKKIQETNILWNYCNNNIINYRFIYDIYPTKCNNISFVLSNHSLTNHNQYLGYCKLTLKPLEKIIKSINIDNCIFNYNWNDYINPTEILNVERINSNHNNFKKKIAPGFIIENCILDLINNDLLNKKIGDFGIVIFVFVFLKLAAIASLA